MPSTQTVPEPKSIHELFVEASATHYSRSDVIEQVMSMIDPHQYAHYLRVLISSRFASEIGRERNRFTPSVRRGASKRDIIRGDYWEQFLSQRIFLSDGWKHLRDATADDLAEVAEYRRAQASDLLSQAERFTALADMLRQSGAATLADLSASEGERILERAA